MYKPAPPRRKKTNIIRSRNGCQSCRQKRRKCDEAKPICERCQKMGLQCHYSGRASLQFHDATDWTFNKIHKAKTSALAGRPALVTRPVPPAASVVARSTCDQMEPNTELHGQTIDQCGEEAASCPLPPLGPYLDSGLQDIFHDIPYLPSLSLEMPVTDAGQQFQSASFSDPFLSITGDYERPTNASSHLLAHPTPSVLNLFEPDLPTGMDAAHLTCPNCICVPGLIPIPTASPLFPKTPDTGPLLSATSERPNALFPQGYTKEAAALASSLTICPSVKHAHRIFLAHFLTSVYDLIPGRDLALRQLVIQVEAVQMAAMALAAANLANVEGAYAYSANRTRQSWIPKKTYVDESLNFANQVSSLTDGSLLDSKAAIAIRLLLAYRELEVGTIRNLILQTVAIERALINMNEDLATNPEDVWIWRATINIRALLRATIGPFQRVDSETLHQRAITSLDAHFSTDPHLIHYLVASAIHISTRIILSRTLGEDCKDPEKLARKISEWHAIMLGMGNLPDMRTPDADMDMHLTEDRLFEHLELLEEQARLYRPGVSDFLEDLLPYLTQDDPIEVLDNVDYMSIEPLELGDHETTMTAALYIFAQIICSSTLLRNMLDGAESQFSGARWNPTDHDRSRPWLHLLLRVARALAFRPADLPRRNTYRRGITPMLFFAAVRYRDVRILNFLDNFLADMDRAGVAWEDIQSPVSLIRLTIGIVQQEIGAGRTIFKVGSTFAYTRSLKDMVVTDTDELLVLHGRNEHGKYFNKAVPFKMGKRGNGLDFDSALGFAEPVL